MSRQFRLTKVLGLLAAALSTSFAQEKEMPQLHRDEIPSLEVVSTRPFAGKALYGYIDGGAELYLEYGFDRAIVQEIHFNGEAYSVEVFRMSDPAAALGIFTVSRGNCGQVDSLSRFSCISTYAAQWALSDCFVRIANSSGSPAAQAGELLLARLLSKKIQGDSIEIPSILAAAGKTEHRLLYVRGTLGMQNGLDEWSALVDGLEGFEAYLVVRQDSSVRTLVGDFRFRKDSDMKKFRSVFLEGSKHRQSQEKDNRRIIVMESDVPMDSLWSRLIRLP